MRCCLSGTYPGGGELRPVFWEPGPERRMCLTLVITEMRRRMHVHKIQMFISDARSLWAAPYSSYDYSNSGVSIIVWIEVEPGGVMQKNKIVNEHLCYHLRHYKKTAGEAPNRAVTYLYPLLLYPPGVSSVPQGRQRTSESPGFLTGARTSPICTKQITCQSNKPFVLAITSSSTLSVRTLFHSHHQLS